MPEAKHKIKNIADIDLVSYLVTMYFGLRLTVVIIAFAAYFWLFLFSYQFVGASAFVLVVFPVILSSILFGFIGGIIVGFMTFPINAVITTYIGLSGPANILSVAYLTGIFIVIGSLIGSLRIRENYSRLQSKAAGAFAEKIKVQGLLESIGDGVIAIDKEWNIILWNKAASDISGWAKDEVMGKPFRSVVRLLRTRDQKENIVFLEEAFLFGEVRHIEEETVLVAKDGKEVKISDSAAPVKDENNKVVGVVFVFHDASHERETSLLRSAFAYASHQLRTPVNQALWNVENALQEKSPEKSAEALSIAYISLKNVNKLVNQLIDVSELEQGIVIPKFETVRIGELLGEIIKTTSVEAGAHNVNFISEPISPALSVETDSILLKRVLIEVIENALNYNISKGEVRLSVITKEGGIIIEIRDSGPGIPEDQQALVFTKFFRGNNIDAAKVIGAGLGLYLSREYMGLIGGRIFFTSQAEKGTVFSIFVPAHTK